MLLMPLGTDLELEMLFTLPCISPATLSTFVSYTFITYIGPPKTLDGYRSYDNG